MARIKIKDIPKDMKISKDIMKKIRGGFIENGGMNSPCSKLQGITSARDTRH